MDFHVLLDAPSTATSRLQIAKLGDFKSAKYGDFSITREDVEAWKENLQRLPGRRALIDLDHQADRTPRNTEAAGWITSVDIEGDTPVAQVEWTPVGQQSIAEKRYLFFSPTYGDYKDESGTVHKNALIGGALTNRPFLSMPTVTLASEERVSEALAEALDASRAKELGADQETLQGLADERSDSRRTMETEILTALELDESADTAKVLEAIQALKTPVETEPETKTLEQQAAEANKVLLDASKYAELSSGAAEGKAAAAELREQRFVSRFEQAKAAGKAVPSQEENYRKLYAADPELALTMLDDAQPIVNVKPIGGHTAEGDEQITLDQKVRDRAKELNVTYDVAYLKVLDELEGKS